MNRHHIVTVALMVVSTIAGVIAGCIPPFLLALTGLLGSGMGGMVVGMLIGVIVGGGGLPLYVFWQRQKHFQHRAIATERFALFMGAGLLFLAGLGIALVTVLRTQPEEISQNFNEIIWTVAHLSFLLPTLGAIFTLSRRHFRTKHI